MNLQLQNSAQHKIADLLWVAETQKEVEAIIRVFGHDGLVVYHMMVAATFDEVDNTELATKALERFIK